MPVEPYSLGELAFYWRMTYSDDDEQPVPALLPFAFDYQQDLELITQAPNPIVLETLQKTYTLDSNIGYMQEGHDLADKYGLDFLSFLESFLQERSARRILDVGCGGCYILHALKNKGFEVFGLDPGPLTARWGEKLDIPVATGFYPFEHGFGKMDVVLSSGVLEHVPDPVAFLRAHKKDLAPGGCVVISTPDNELSIELGDPSMLLHEHISYFEENSLIRTVRAAGYRVLKTAKAKYGQTLYVLAIPEENSVGPGEMAPWTSFTNRLNRSIRQFSEFVGPLLKDPEVDLGFYVPLRSLPYLSMLKVFDGFRFFDDDSGTHGKLFDGFSVPVEGWDDFLATPPTHVMVMSLPHAEVIKKKIRNRFSDSIEVTTLEQILTV